MQRSTATGSRVGRGCTTSTSAKAGTSYFLMTAGHCIRPNEQGFLGDPAAINPLLNIGIGRLKNQFEQQTRTACDCTLIGPIPQGAATNQVIVSGAGTLYPYAGLGDGNPGDPACASGFQTALEVTGGAVLCGEQGAYGGYLTRRDDGRDCCRVG